MRTLSELLIDSNAALDLEASLPTGTELTTRTNYANQAVWEASSIAQFDEFKSVYTYFATGATVPLPSNFREFMTAPRTRENGAWKAYEQIKPEAMYEKEDNDPYFYILGNPASSYVAVFNNLSANATISMVIQRYPSGLATLTDICELPDPQFVVSKIKTYVLESRGDERFPLSEADAQTRLKNMVGRSSKTPGGGQNTTKRTGSAGYEIS